jgi:hypothetical protein
MRITLPSVGTADFSIAWRQPLSDCDARRNSAPATTAEAAALKIAAGGDDIETLYELCAVVDPKDVYAEPDFSAGAEQILEILAALALCPSQPHATAWKQSVARGQRDVALAKDGRLFSDGVHLVGSEIKPGTYAISGDIEDCYWERQNKSGETIQNNFIEHAKRVQVTIRSTDYAFMSEGCGEWRPA